jgi:uncharacterized integral membrane protein
MPWRLVTFVVILGVVVIFSAFNTTNTSDISFGFFVAKDVPIFLSLFFAFAVGVIIMVPFLIGTAKSKRGRRGTKEPGTPNVDVADSFTPDVE